MSIGSNILSFVGIAPKIGVMRAIGKKHGRAIMPPAIGETRLEQVRAPLSQQLAVAILSGDLPEGHVFPDQIEYAEQLGISRSALRESFRVLAAKGLIDSRPKSGTRVNPRTRWSLLDPDLLAWQFEAEPAEQFLKDLFELRLMLEPRAAELAAVRRTDEEIAAMREALDAMARHSLATPAGRQADQHFHHIMLVATRNAVVAAMSTSIMAAIAWTTIHKQRKRALARDPIPDHRAVFDAIAAGNAAAAGAAMADLISLAQADTRIGLID